MFVSEFPVFACVNYFYYTAWNVCYFFDSPEESNIGVVSSMHEEQGSPLEGHFCSSDQLVHAYCVLGVGALLVHNVYLQTNDNHRHCDLNHCFITFICSKI